MEIIIHAAYGDATKKVVISKPFGAGDQYHIMINNFYSGSLMKRQGSWEIPGYDMYTSDDIQILGNWVEENNL